MRSAVDYSQRRGLQKFRGLYETLQMYARVFAAGDEHARNLEHVVFFDGSRRIRIPTGLDSAERQVSEVIYGARPIHYEQIKRTVQNGIQTNRQETRKKLGGGV